MKRVLLLVISLIPSLAIAASTVPPSFADLVEKLSPAVVNISTTQMIKTAGNPGLQMFGNIPNTPEFAPFREFFEQHNGAQAPQEKEVTSLGSGFIIDPSGYIITNNHVIDAAEEITVRLSDNTKLKATIVGRDKKIDIALLKVKSDKPLPFVPLGDSDKARVGDWVIAIGNPFGLGGTVTAGIISARQRSINSGPFDDFIQTDAAINRGNSGGPLFNEDGEVIGINSAIFSPTGTNIGIGFSIPTNLAKPVLDQLKQYGRTHRGWLGVKIQEINDEVAESLNLKKTSGALVAGVSKGSPAEKAGIKSGDVITAYNGKEISEMRFLPRMVAETKIGESVRLSVLRGGKPMDVNVKIGELKEGDDGDSISENDAPEGKQGSATGPSVLGMNLAPLDANDRKALRLEATTKGIVVTGVASGSDAFKRGLKPGDVITEVNNTSVASVNAFRGAVEDSKKAGRKFVLITIVRQGESAFVTLPLK